MNDLTYHAVLRATCIEDLFTREADAIGCEMGTLDDGMADHENHLPSTEDLIM
jgi:hypothetical protein